MDAKKSKEQFLNESVRHYRAGRYNEALRSCEQALQRDPNYFLAYYGKGLALYELKLYKEALATFEVVNKMRPSYGPAYRGKGDVLAKLKRYYEAIQFYHMAIPRNSDSIRTYYCLAQSYYEVQAYEDAVDCYLQAEKLVPFGSKIGAKIYLEREKAQRIVNLNRIGDLHPDLQENMMSWYETLRSHYEEDIPKELWESEVSSQMIEAAPIGYSKIWDDDFIMENQEDFIDTFGEDFDEDKDDIWEYIQEHD